MKVKKVLHQKTLTFKEGEEMCNITGKIDRILDYYAVYLIGDGLDHLTNPISIIIKVYEQEET
jgi:hypothetical protein